jgi:hypothetical protein
MTDLSEELKDLSANEKDLGWLKERGRLKFITACSSVVYFNFKALYSF